MIAYKKILTYILFFIVLFGTIKNTAFIVFYELNRDTFINLFCENNNNPELECNGQCQLTLIAKTQQEQNASDVLKTLQTEIFFYYEAPISFQTQQTSFAQTTPFYGLYHAGHYQFLFSNLNLRPPTKA